MARHKHLGHLEQQVMDFLWRNDPSTSDVVRAAVGKDRPLSDSTIRTVLRRLEAKQYVRHTTEGRQFIYSSVREPRRVAAEAVKTLLKNFCRGSLEELLTGLVDHQVVDSAELRRLSERIEAEDRKRRKKS
jgi:BlaI family transcriptional regulator, penicillinase repressor